MSKGAIGNAKTDVALQIKHKKIANKTQKPAIR